MILPNISGDVDVSQFFATATARRVWPSAKHTLQRVILPSIRRPCGGELEFQEAYSIFVSRIQSHNVGFGIPRSTEHLVREFRCCVCSAQCISVDSHIFVIPRCLAAQVLVFNCDEGIDFQSMGRIFIGLVKVRISIQATEYPPIAAAVS